MELCAEYQVKYNEFKKLMTKPVFTFTEVKRLAWKSSAETLRLQLHQFVQKGYLIRLKRGVYGWPERIQNHTEVALVLRGPSYVSLQSVLQRCGLMPDAVFALTLVTTKTTRTYQTPLGQFVYHHIKPALFWGYDPDTFWATPEKALIDYFYLYSAQLYPQKNFWQEARFQNLSQIHFKTALHYAQKTGVKKVVKLVQSLEEYGKT